MVIRYLILTFILLYSVGQAQAASFDEYIDRLAEHPQVVAILAKSVHFNELADGEMGLPDPVITLGVDNMPVDDPVFDRFLPTAKVFGFKQNIPNYSFRKAKSEQQEFFSQKQQLLAEYTLQRLQSMFTGMLASLDKVKQQKVFAKEQLTYYKSLDEYFKGQMEAGSGVYWRFSQVDVERSLIEVKLSDLQSEEDDIEAELIRLVGEVPDIPLPNIPNIHWGKNAQAIYPVIIASKDIAVAVSSVDKAGAAFYPNYGVNAAYKQRESGSDFASDDWFSLKANISIPLWYYWNQKPKLRAAKAQRRSAESDYENVRILWVRKLDALYSKRDAALRNVKIFVQKDNALSEMVAAAQRNYEAGQTNLDTVLDAQINQLTIKSQLAKQRAQHLILSAQFNSYIVGDK